MTNICEATRSLSSAAHLYYTPDLFSTPQTIGERKFECVQGHKSRRSQFSTTYSHHHPTRARIASNTPPTAPDHSPHTPDAPCTARFEPESRRTVGCGLNMTLAPTWPAGSASWPRHMLHNILISRSPGIRACATTRRAPTRQPPDRGHHKAADREAVPVAEILLIRAISTIGRSHFVLYPQSFCEGNPRP